MTGPGEGRSAASELLRWGTARLPAHEARLLLEWVLHVDSLLMVQSVGPTQKRRYQIAVEMRLMKFPLQHITGEAWFRGIRLKVGPGVFIPRPETEMLVEYALHVPNVKRAVDLCSGSGAIARCLAEAGKDVVAVEISERALPFTRQNLTGTNAKVLNADALHFESDSFDLVVSNPPYVDAPVLKDVLFDPDLALYGGGQGGMSFPAALIRHAASLLRPGGCLLMEHGETQGPTLLGVAAKAGYVSFQTLTDLAGRPRFLKATC